MIKERYFFSEKIRLGTPPRPTASYLLDKKTVGYPPPRELQAVFLDKEWSDTPLSRTAKIAQKIIWMKKDGAL